MWPLPWGLHSILFLCSPLSTSVLQATWLQPSPPTVYFTCLCPTYFFTVDLHSSVHKQVTKSILGCLEISSAKTINLKLFNLASGRFFFFFFDKGRKQPNSLPNLTGVVSSSAAELVPSETSLGLHSPHCYQYYCLSVSYKDGPISTAYIIQLLLFSRVPKFLHSSRT